MTRAWTRDELDRVGRAEELRVTSRRPDGTLRPFTTIWVARAGEELFIRSAHGPANGWYRRALASRTGRIRVSGVEQDVRFEPVDPADQVHDTIDRAYHAKYDRHGPRYVGTVVGSPARETTLRLISAGSSAS